MPSRRTGWHSRLVSYLLVLFVSSQEVVQLSQEGLAVDAVNHASFLNGLAAGRGAAQAVHADFEEHGSSGGCDIQNITDNGIFFNFYSDFYDLLLHLLTYYNLPFSKKQGGKYKRITGQRPSFLNNGIFPEWLRK